MLRWDREDGPSRGRGLLFNAQALEALVESGELAARIEQLLLAASPGRMRARIDFEMERVARFAVGRPGLVGRAVGHDDRDLVIIRVDSVFHGYRSREARFIAAAPDSCNRFAVNVRSASARCADSAHNPHRYCRSRLACIGRNPPPRADWAGCPDRSGTAPPTGRAPTTVPNSTGTRRCGSAVRRCVHRSRAPSRYWSGFRRTAASAPVPTW